MEKYKYSPQSRFLTDYQKLINTHQDSDSFGPVKNSETTRFRTTSFVRTSSSQPVEVYSINNGQLAIVPGADADKINIVVKNTNAIDYAPLKIKYFIYRGIKKSDYIDANGNMVKYTNSNQPKILQTLWKNFQKAYGTSTVFSASLVGYDTTGANDNKLLDQLFQRKFDIQCSKHDLIGYFTEKLGLDIVLDDGEYILENQQASFNLNVEYAKGKDFVFDVSSMPTTKVEEQVKVKRYKEYIHLFIDAAAFWGSHIKDGKIFVSNTNSFESLSEIYDNFLDYYPTKNRIYLYIKTERNKSFNFHKPKLVKGFEDQSLNPNRNYSTYGWPILYNEGVLPINVLPEDEREENKSGVKIELECNVSNNEIGVNETDPDKGDYKNNIIPKDQYLAIYNLTNSEKMTAYSLEDGFNKDAGTGIMTYDFYIKYFVYAKSSSNLVCSNFLMFSTNLEQDFPLENYYNKLWVANINTPFTNYSTLYKAYKANYDRNLNVNLNDALRLGAIVKQDIIFDKGKNGKKRRLYITSIKRNYKENSESKDRLLNVDTKPPVNTASDLSTVENYMKFVYGSTDFCLYKGSFKDNSNTISSLSLVNTKNHWLKNSYLHLGITEDNYNAIFSSANASVFNESDDFLFYLREISAFADESVRKFELGVQYDNGIGELTTYFPTTPIYIYTLDGMLFFSGDYSDSQSEKSCKEFSSNAIAHFRPLPSWNGEFGFDWVRIGDSGTKGDTNGDGGKPDRTYKSNMGSYYKDVSTGVKKQFVIGGTATFKKEKKEYLSFMNYNYFLYPAKLETSYATSRISLYPDKNEAGIALGYPKNRDAKKSCLTEADVNLKIKITGTVSKLRLEFDKNIFDIVAANSSDISTTYVTGNNKYLEINGLTATTSRIIGLKIKCLKETEENLKIRVLSTESNKEKLAGEVTMYPNHESERKKINFAFLDCKTNFTGSVKKFNFLDPNNVFFKKYLSHVERLLNHAYIEIDSVKIVPFDLTSSSTSYNTFNTDWTKNEGTRVVIDFNKKLRLTAGGKEYLVESFLRLKARSIFNSGANNLLDSDLIITSINEFSDLKGAPILGIAERLQPPKSLIMLEDGFYDDATTKEPTFVFAHEGYHTLGCDHTFSYEEKNLFTPQYSLTDNIMDYGHNNLGDPIDGTSIWWYQRYFARKNYNKILRN